ncbi:MAG TPA: tetratricopeptide repeat protein [Bryobacteraceae bacterium]|nr:tetratricopeptide repeat protein [Bryobacteraceae bacterium]
MSKQHQWKRRLLTGAAFFLFPALALSQADDLAAQSHHAKELMAAGRFEEAIPIYQKLVAALPGNPGFLLNLGLAEEMAGHPQQAIPHFQAVLRNQPENVPALTSLGTAALQTNQAKLALAPLEKLTKVQPSDLNARGMLAGAYMSLQQFAKAASQFHYLTTVSPSDPKAWYGLGKAYESLAANSFSQLAKVAPQSPYLAALLADSRFQRKQYRSAYFFYKQAESKLPGLPGVHAGLANVYTSTSHPDWAASERTAEQKLPAPNCASNAAECRFFAKDYTGAAKLSSVGTGPENLFWLTKAYNQLALDSFDHLGHLGESVEIHALKAQILHGHGQDAEAAAEWHAALGLAPGNPRLQVELATSLFLAHKYDEVMPMLKNMLAQEPNAPDLNFMLGESLWRTQQAEKAVPYLTTAVKLDPQLLPAQAALGMVYALLNQNTEAIPHLEKAVTLDDDGSLHYSLARAYQAAGDSAGARKTMTEYQQIKQKNQQINDELAKEAEIAAP